MGAIEIPLVTVIILIIVRERRAATEWEEEGQGGVTRDDERERGERGRETGRWDP